MKQHWFKSMGGGLLALVLLGQAPAARAAVSAAEAAKLQSELTPVGAEKAGNKEGTIPAWTGGFSPRTAPVNGRRTDPYATEKPLYSITAQTVDKYADKLTPGVLAMFKKYPQTYRVDVYPGHRPAAMPKDFYDATFKGATATKVVRTEDGAYLMEGDTGGIPFPIPKEGAEAILNNNFAYAPLLRMNASNYLLQSNGRRVLVSTYQNHFARYFTKDTRVKDGRYLSVRSVTSGPAIRTGEQIVQHNYTESSKDTAWVYLPGQRRVRKLPNSCCDTPTPFSSGLISFDEISLFFGSINKFDWKLLGKKEMLIPYNNNDYMVPTSDDDVIGATHLNPDHVRWELHRVWVVEAKLREGQRHVSPRSTYYLDEDTWSAVLADRYDAQGKLARTGYQLSAVLTETATVFAFAFGWHDLLSGAAYISNVYNEQSDQLKVLDSLPDAKLTPEAMAGEGVR